MAKNLQMQIVIVCLIHRNNHLIAIILESRECLEINMDTTT